MKNNVVPFPRKKRTNRDVVETQKAIKRYNKEIFEEQVGIDKHKKKMKVVAGVLVTCVIGLSYGGYAYYQEQELVKVETLKRLKKEQEEAWIAAVKARYNPEQLVAIKQLQEFGDDRCNGCHEDVLLAELKSVKLPLNTNFKNLKTHADDPQGRGGGNCVRCHQDESREVTSL